jgi:two-component system response regulator YesN
MFQTLIIDDEYLAREALNVAISKTEGSEKIFLAKNAKDALEIFQNEKNKIDVIFTELVVNGAPITNFLKAIYKSDPDASVFILSNYNDFSLLEPSLKAKVRKFISKPVYSGAIKKVLEDYRESVKNDPGNILNEFFNIITRRDFSGVYYRTPELVSKICEGQISKDLTRLKEFFLTLRQTAANYLNSRTGANESLEDFFPINDALLKDQKQIEYCLFNLLNYIFIKLSANRYEILENVFNYINDNINENLSLRRIVAKCNISQGYLSRIFKRQFNVSVMEYIHMRKLAIAKAYMSFTSMSAGDIAFRLSYGESGYFGKVFKKYENATIYQYRNIKNNASRF